MRTKIVILLSILVLLIGGTLASKAYSQHQDTQKAKVAESQKQLQAAQDKQKQVFDRVVASNNQLYQECQKGLKSYEALTPTLKKGQFEPKCGKPILQ